MKYLIKSFIYSFILLFIVSCAVNPVTGKREFMLLTEEDEIQLGKQTDPQIVQTYGVYQDEQLTEYVDNMGQKMGKLSHRPQLNYEFKIMDSPVINAFAVPGGFVYFTRGIMAYLNSEAELAGVMGHEIGHITARHSAKQYSKAQLAQLGLGVGSILSETFAQYAGLAAQGIGILFLKFSRDNERQADNLGVEYSSKAGYDAGEMSNFFVTLNRMHGDGGGSLPGFLSTHPNPDDRVGAIQRRAQQWQKNLEIEDFDIRRDAYLEKIDGIVFGNDPRQGFVENNVFYHPQLRFQYPVPADWKVINLPTQVQVTSGDEKAAILFSLGTESSPSAQANKFISDSKATVQSQRDLTINGFKARQMESLLASESGNLRILSTFLEKDGSVYVFHGFSADTDFNTYSGAFRNTMNGFETLRDRAKLNVKPDRIRIRTVRGSQTLEQALKSFNAAEEDMETLSLINGMPLNETLTPGSKIKVIEKG